MRIAILFLAAGLLQGCAAMNEHECVQADWQTLGFEDGSAGKPPSALAPRRKACAKHQVQPDLAAYRSGHLEGLEAYCSPGRGFSEGSRGRRYEGVCPAFLEPAFLEGFRAGARLHDLQLALNATERALGRESDALHALEHEIGDKEKRLVADGVPAAERARILLTLKDLQRERGDLIEAVAALTQEVDLQAAELAQYREQLGVGYTPASY